MNRQGQIQDTKVRAVGALAGRVLQRKCACGNHTAAGGQCGECARKNASLRRKSSNENAVGEAPQIVHDVLRSSGQPLDAQTRAFMEPRFERDFRGVRVHTTAKAAESSVAMNALAYTVGPNIVFAHQQYQPNTLSGRRLLAHELTHTVQQSGQPAAIQGRLLVGASGDAYEREADQISDRVTSEDASSIGGMSSVPVLSLQRECIAGKGWEFEYDGCSGPDLAGPFFDRDNPAGGKNTQFGLHIPTSRGGRACDRHDECYQTCHPSESSKNQCDDEMLNNMLSTCTRGSENQGELMDCVKWAVIYRELLRSFGDEAFWERQVAVCHCNLINPQKSAPSEDTKKTPEQNKNEQPGKLKKAEPPKKAKESSPTKTLKMPLQT
jgi:hypothetical protein